MNKENANSVHPCFSKEANKKYTRLHIPIAPGCNIQCGYCSRKTDCPNESRPGVSSTVLSPDQAEFYALRMMDQDPSIKIIGVAGPGDAFNDPERTIETLAKIRAHNKDVQFCVSTNGLNSAPYIDRMVEVGLSHLTVTVNAVDPVIGAEVYQWVRYQKHRYLGEEAANILLEQQKETIIKAATAGLVVKVNTVFLPGINDFHIPEIAETVKSWGASTQNIIPFMPIKDSKFEDFSAPDHADVVKLRLVLGSTIHQMTHCGRCRADAAGRIGEKNSKAVTEILENASKYKKQSKEKTYKYAAATKEGILVNSHLGEADTFHIFKTGPAGLQFEEERTAPESGESRWENVYELLSDCDALFVSGAGPSPLKVFQERGFDVHVCEGVIEEIVEAYEETGDISAYKPFNQFACGSGCSGNASGCS